MKTTTILIISMLISANAFGYSIPSDAGKSGMAFLKVGVGSRNLAMGDVGTASAYDATAVFYNPALLPLASSRGLFFSHHAFIQDINQQYFGGNFKWLGNNYFGFGLNLFTIPGIEKRTVASRDPMFEFNAHDFAMSLSWGREITTNFAAGVGTKMIYEKIDVDDLTAFAFDIGAVYDPMPMLRIGASVKNIGPQAKFISEKFDLPREFRFGAAFMPQNEIASGKWTLAADLSKPIDADLRGHLGVEYSYKDIFAPRLGYMVNYSDKNISAGFGLRLKEKFSFDYAYVPFSSDLGNAHHFSVGVWFK